MIFCDERSYGFLAFKVIHHARCYAEVHGFRREINGRLEAENRIKPSGGIRPAIT